LDNLLIHAENVSARFGNVTVFKNISFRLETGSSMAITGPNGSGKSTLLQIVAGLQRTVSGTVTRRVNDAEITVENFSAYAGYTGPLVNPYDMLSAVENLQFTVTDSTAMERISDMLAYFDLYKDRNKIVKYYSSGMKQRLKLIHAFINDPVIIMLDEPASALDPISTQKIEELIQELKQNYTIIIVTHNMQQAARVSDYTAFFYMGELIEINKTETIFTKPEKIMTENYITGKFG
jgi:phosphate transport system ATP-binding protein